MWFITWCLLSEFNLVIFWIISGLNCTPPAIEDFPPDIFNEKQRQSGAVIFHVLVSLYLFVALAVVCDKFFVPAVEKICHGNSKKKKKHPLVRFGKEFIIEF